MSWKLLQRSQQLVGAVAVMIPGALFVWWLADPSTLDQFRVFTLDQFRVFVPSKPDNPPKPENPPKLERLDHIHIAIAIGSCHFRSSPVTWPKEWLVLLKVTKQELLGQEGYSPALQEGVPPTLTPVPATLMPLESAAIYHSDRISSERTALSAEAETKQNRLRSAQTRILFVSAAAAFLVGLRTLVASKDADLPFRSLTQGSLLPISVLVLLVPVIGTVLSGQVAFDNDATTAIRDTRALSQLEQLHGRIAENVVSDPYLCPLVNATSRLAAASGANPANRALDACLFDRFQRTNAWEQRHEQILNDASRNLEQAGDLLKATPPSPTSTPPSPKSTRPSEASDSSVGPGGDKCQAAFNVSPEQASGAFARLPTPPTQAQASSARNRGLPTFTFSRNAVYSTEPPKQAE